MLIVRNQQANHGQSFSLMSKLAMNIQISKPNCNLFNEASLLFVYANAFYYAPPQQDFDLIGQSIEMSLFYGNKDPQGQHHQGNQEHKPNQQINIKEKKDVDSRASIFLAKDKQPEKEPGCCERCCSCCTCPSLKDHFKVTNKDVAKRIGSNIKFWSGGFFTPAEQEYDIYGPFWLYTTMIFVVGAVHNILLYQNNPKSFQYDYQILLKALTAFYGFGFLLSVLIGLLFGCLGLQSKTSQIVCLYGYSMVVYIICVMLCAVNMTLLTWVFLLYAATTKVVYVLKNIFESCEVPAGKKFMITVIVIIEAALQFLIIKFGFIKSSNSGAFSGGFSHMAPETYHDFTEEGFLHLRSFANL